MKQRKKATFLTLALICSGLYQSLLEILKASSFHFEYIPLSAITMTLYNKRDYVDYEPEMFPLNPNILPIIDVISQPRQLLPDCHTPSRWELSPSIAHVKIRTACYMRI